ACAYGVPLDGGDGHDARVTQPQEPFLPGGDPYLELGVSGGQPLLAGNPFRREQAQVDPGAEGGPRASHHDHADLGRKVGADGSESVPDRGGHRVAALGSAERHRGDRLGDVQAQPARLELRGANGHGVVLAASPGVTARAAPGPLGGWPGGGPGARVVRNAWGLALAQRFPFPGVAPPGPRSDTPVSVRIRWTKP